MSGQGVTFDAGVLIALERRKERPWKLYRRARSRGAPITIPTPVVVEWWRGRTDLAEALLRSVHVEPLTEPIARLAGEALAEVPGATAIDAIVMASAALRGDVVLSGDLDDLERLRTFFPGVRVLSVGSQ